MATIIKAANLTGSVSRQAGGLFESVRRLVQSLAKAGMEVRVFGTEDEFTASDLGAWRPVTVSAYRPSWPARFGYSCGFMEGLREFEPDVVHTHGLWLYPSVAAHSYCRRRRVPYVISPHGMLDPWAMGRSRWKKAAARLLYEQAHLRDAQVLRALCDAEARAMRAAGLRNPIAIIPNGIDLPEVRSSECGVRTEEEAEGVMPERGAAVISNQYSEASVRSPDWEGMVEPGSKVLLYLGRIHPKKGLVDLVRAWAGAGGQSTKVRGQGAGWVLAIAGWGQDGHEVELKRLASELGIRWAEVSSAECGIRSAECRMRNGGVSMMFLGPQFGEAKEACLRGSAAFVLPSLSEGVPMAVLEAWARGKPALITPACHLPEGIGVGAAIPIEPELDSIRAGLEALFAMSEAERGEMGRAGLRLVAEQYTWPRVAEQMRQLYEFMLGGGPAPGCLADF